MYLSDDLDAAVTAAGLPLADLIRRGVAAASTAHAAPAPARRARGTTGRPGRQQREAAAEALASPSAMPGRYPCCAHCRHGGNVAGHADPCTQGC